jgi:hypothetical protein
MEDGPIWPHFIIGGAPRSGTTFLCQALARHPCIHMARPFVPEPKVFFGPERDVAWYQARYAELFGHTSEVCETFGVSTTSGRLRGEKTANYLESDLACERIGRFLPAVKMIFLFREPVARAYSNYLWSKKNGLETLTFEEAIAREGTRPSPFGPDKAHARPFDYLSRGDYAPFARRYLDALGRGRVAFFLYEEIATNPAGLLGRVQRFLGVERLALDKLNVGIVNSARDMGPELDRDLQARLKERMTPLVQTFAELSGLDLSLWQYPTAARGMRIAA